MVEAKQVLIIEQNRYMQECLSYILTEEGYQVQMTDNEKTALQIVQNTRIDLILLDGGLNAEYFVHNYRLNASKLVPVVLLTSLSNSDARTHAQKVQATAFICKPFRLGSLLNQVSFYINLEQHNQSGPAGNYWSW